MVSSWLNHSRHGGYIRSLRAAPLLSHCFMVYNNLSMHINTATNYKDNLCQKIFFFYPKKSTTKVHNEPVPHFLSLASFKAELELRDNLQYASWLFPFKDLLRCKVVEAWNMEIIISRIFQTCSVQFLMHFYIIINDKQWEWVGEMKLLSWIPNGFCFRISSFIHLCVLIKPCMPNKNTIEMLFSLHWQCCHNHCL